jgi:putative membrane protein
MKIQKTMALVITSAALIASAVQAQVSTQELYSVKFRATATAGDNQGKRIKITDRELIREAVGTNISNRDVKRNYELVYNPATDSIQVVTEADGSLVSDVFIFQGGTNVIVGESLQRFTFVFSPTQSEAIGSAVITERAVNNNNGRNRARITGKMQFTVPADFGSVNTAGTAPTINDDSSNTNSNATSGDGTSNTNIVSGSTNVTDIATGDTNGVVDNGQFVQASAAATATNSEVKIATGTFSAGRAFVPGQNNGGNTDDENVDTGGTPGTGGTNDNNGTGGTNSTRDVTFVNEAAQSGLAEIQLAQLAIQNSTNQAVVAFAQQMIQEHTQLNLQLTQLAAQKGIEVPTALDNANQATVNRLTTLQGQRFDDAFRSEAISAHRRAVQLFQNEANNGDDTELKSFAQNNLTALQQHLTEALQLP